MDSAGRSPAPSTRHHPRHPQTVPHPPRWTPLGAARLRPRDIIRGTLKRSRTPRDGLRWAQPSSVHATSSAAPSKGGARRTMAVIDGGPSVRHGYAMAEIELAPLSHRLDDDEMKTLARLLDEAGGPQGGKGDEHPTHTNPGRPSGEALTEFLDRLDAHDIGAEIYLPLEFEGRITVGDYRVASSQLLLEVLEEMKEELDVDAEEEEEDEEEEE